MPLDEQKELIDDIRAEIDPPGPSTTRPPGVEAEVAGLPALAADANSELSGSRYWLTARRPARGRRRAARRLPLAATRARPADPDRARDRLVGARARGDGDPAQPDVGDARRARDRDRDRVQRHPLGPLPRGARGGRSVGEALRRTYARTGAAVLASGSTAIAGFARPDRATDDHDAARLRPRHRRRPRRRPARRDARAARRRWSGRRAASSRFGTGWAASRAPGRRRCCRHAAARKLSERRRRRPRSAGRPAARSEPARPAGATRSSSGSPSSR